LLAILIPQTLQVNPQHIQGTTTVNILIKTICLVLPVATAATFLPKSATETSLIVSGTVEARISRVGSLTGGRVSQILVQEGQRVMPGDILMVLEKPELMPQAAAAESMVRKLRSEVALLEKGSRPEEIATAKAVVQQCQAQLELLRNGSRQEEIESAKLDYAAAKSQLEYQTRSYDRIKKAATTHAISQEQRDAAHTQLRVARAEFLKSREHYIQLRRGSRKENIQAAEATLEQATQQLALAVAGNRAEEITAKRAELQVCEAQLSEIQSKINELTVRSPIEGHVQSLDLHLGNLVSAGTPLAILVDANDWWVECFVPVATPLRSGDKMQVGGSGIHSETIEATVGFVATDAEFMPDNLQTTDARARQVVKVKLTAEGLQQLSRPGMLVDVGFGQRASQESQPELVAMAN